MSAEVLREAAQAMREHGGLNLCDCGDDACHDNWYARWVLAVADLLDSVASTDLGRSQRETHEFCDIDCDVVRALAVARAYLSQPS